MGGPRLSGMTGWVWWGEALENPMGEIRRPTWQMGRPRMPGRTKSLLNEEHLLRCYNVRNSKANGSSIFYSILSRYANLRNSLGIFSFLRPSVSLNELYLNE